MIREAELFVMAEEMLLEVLGRIRPAHRNIVIAPMFDMPGADRPRPVRELVAHYARDDAWVPDMLAGRTMAEVGPDKFDGDLLGTEPQAALTRIVEAACAAARTVEDPDTTVHCSFGDISTPEYLLQLDIARSFLAHDIAMALGSRACPLPEELARPLYELTAPEAERWRSYGVFRAPLPLPDGHVSWRDRFLLMAGRDPHPFLNE
ncbi:MAG: hypothetical protein JOY78_07290 [Pseudonocardia sp.]|nr:hypothetical protein [Pseudonocardia sp.]